MKWNHRAICILLAAFFFLFTAGCGDEIEGDFLVPRSLESQPQESEPEQSTVESSEISSGSEEIDGSAPDSSQGAASAPGSSSAAPANPSASSPSSAAGALQVRGTRLTDRNGNTVQLRGISTHGIAWYPDYINESCFRQLRQEWNVNVVRLAMYTEEYGGYCSGGDQNALKELIHKGVTCASSQGLYVIIDWHILSDGNPNRHLKEAKDFFAEMSAKYKNYDNVLYEICNEPNGGTSWNEIKAYAEEVIGTIRSNDKDAVILVGTPNWSQYVDQAAANPITKYDNIMYTLHFYAATHTDSLRNTMAAAIGKGLPVFVSEFGICDASGNGGINTAQADQWVDLMDRNGVSYVAWNLSNKAETSAILRSGCGKTSGFEAADLSDSGKWLYRMLTGKDAVSAGTAPAPAPSPAPPPSSSPSGSGNTASSGGGSTAKPEGKVSYTVQPQNQWESGGEHFFQYSLTVENRSGADCSRWQISVPFNGAVTLSDGWNGDYSVSGTTLSISSKDYNGTVPAGGSTGNIGFIVKGGKELKITQ